MKPCELDWANPVKKTKLTIQQNQNRMEITDEQLERDGEPLATLAALILVISAAAICVSLVLSFADTIDQQAISTKIDHSTIILHEKSGGLKP